MLDYCHNATGASGRGPVSQVQTKIGKLTKSPCPSSGSLSAPSTIAWNGGTNPPLIKAIGWQSGVGQGLLVGMPRTDGITDQYTTIQGVRSYDPQLGSWTTPDAYAGTVHDPMSQQSYMYNDNNPVAYSDPSGFVAKPKKKKKQKTDSDSMDLSIGPCATAPNSAGCHQQLIHIIQHENLQDGYFEGYASIMMSLAAGPETLGIISRAAIS